MSEKGDLKLSHSVDADNKMVQFLTEGLVNMYEPTLKSVKGQLVEIVKKQECLHDEMHRVNLNLSQSMYDFDLQEMFVKIKLYKEKLSSVKKMMMSLHEQSTKLKKRALKLEQQKQREIVDKVEKREYEECLVRRQPI